MVTTFLNSEIQSNLHDLKHGRLLVTQYYNALTYLWQRLDVYDIPRWESLEDARKHKEIVEKERIFKFLLDLNKSLDEVRGRIHGTKPLPSLKEISLELCREENRGELMLGTSSVVATTKVLPYGPEVQTRIMTRRRKGGLGVIIDVVQVTSGRNVEADWKLTIEIESDSYITPSEGMTKATIGLAFFTKEQVAWLQKLINQGSSSNPTAATRTTAQKDLDSGRTIGNTQVTYHVISASHKSEASEKIIGIFEDFLFTKVASGLEVSEKGVLQVLLDVKFATDVLSGRDSNSVGESSGNQKAKLPVRRKQDQRLITSVIRERSDQLLKHLSQRLDPIDWLTYEPYLWKNEKQSYLRHAVLFGFFVQLNRMYTDTVQKLPTNSESNILRCSTVPRFKYLPISAPALSSRGTKKTFAPSSNEISSRSSWNSLTNGELSQKMNLDDNPSFGVAAPFLKSFMQVGSRFGESTLKLGSMLTDGQVGIFKDRSTSAMSFGDILPAQAAGLLSSFTAPRSDS